MKEREKEEREAAV